MTWELDSDRPIYKQLIEHFQLSIVSGCYKPGDKLPSVRDLAAEAAVNPNTMQKALADLEQAGLVYTQRTSGRYITEDKSMVEQLKNNLAIEQIKEFLEKMSRLGFTKQETVALMTSVKEENVQ
ncbi:GntR family transcriptional regulator [Acetanaerobacterium elongatum]|uniref:DNA-binding transcriptional regulator YhcF, GntR family n=1 Tax=Acetanaerobacterium elongatum TaxID=258515 RepID=A0A1G9TX88_9FIRM|nr:GntR family transcriptional regulator [Acetanaerobacterium elongatum]SDM52201.1 DNA-binding transcriptional regulator YhcF, GntR family [Acetanaerobacterium elongatum]